jgi:ribonuclease J
MMIDLGGNAPEVAEYIETGRLYLDGSVMIPALGGVVRDRIRMALNGHVMVTLLLDENDEPLGEAWAELMGLPGIGKTGQALSETIETELGAAHSTRVTQNSSKWLDAYSHYCSI